jgi:DNA-binding MarR family transcriptional regulator
MTYQEKSLNRSVLHLLYRAMQCASNMFEGEIDVMTPRQFAVLAALDNLEDGASQAMLTKQTGIDRSTLSEVVQRLLSKGFVARRRSPTDRRAYTVKLTRQGRAKLMSVRPAVERVDEQVLSMIPARQRESLVTALTALAESCEKRRMGDME